MLELKISISTTARPGRVQVLDVTPDYDDEHPTGYGGPNATREELGLIVAVESLRADGAAGVAILADPYDPYTFLHADGAPLNFAAAVDGIVRVVVAGVGIINLEDYGNLEAGDGYVWAQDKVARIKGVNGTLQTDATLTAAHLFGVADMPVLVYAQTTGYAFIDTVTAGALARLNLRYLQQPENQQQALFDLYRRIRLQRDGAQQLFEDGRYLDAAAVLLGAQHILITNGQTPDAYGPLLSGYNLAS